MLKGRSEKLDKEKDKSLNIKFNYRNFGPYLIESVDEEKHAKIMITPSKFQVFHVNDLIIYKGSEKPFPEGYFTPSLDEIIKVKIPDPRGPTKGEKILSDKNKIKFNIKTIVGKRINVLWNQNKKFYKATVIGYTTNLNHSLVFFDEPTITNGGEEEVDI